MRKIFFVFVICVALAGISYLRYFLIDGFSTRKINYSGEYQKEYDLGIDFETVRDILDQEFVYLGKGRQSYVFESSDKKYVIKFIKYHKYKMPFYKDILEYFNWISEKRKVYFNQKINRYQTAYNSYKIAYFDLAEMTKIKYLHLNQTYFLKKNVVLRDKMGIKHLVDLDKVAFILQERAEDLAFSLKKKKNVEKLIDSFFSSIHLKRKNHIMDKDYSNIIRNSGVIDGNFIEVDVGSFVKNKTLDKKFWKEEFLYVSNLMESFLKDNLEEFLPYYRKRKEEELLCVE